MRGVFVTGTDTGVGKTWVSCGLLRAFVENGLRAVGMKPVASGSAPTPDGLRNDDALALQQSAGISVPYNWMNPYVFEPPIAPHLAAAEAGVQIELPRLLESYSRLREQGDVVVVEGVGGWQVPLSETLSLADLARALGLPVVMVVGMRLGCLNHALLTARAIEADGLQLAGWVANQIDPGFERADENFTTLQRKLPAPLLARIPYLQVRDPSKAGDYFTKAVRQLT